MARDRLAAMRAQQQGGDSYGGNYDPTPRQTRQNPYDQRGPNPYDQRDNYDQRNNIELSQVGNRNNFDSPVDEQSAFYNELSSIQDEINAFNDNIDKIARLHGSVLRSVDSSDNRQNSELDNLTDDTQAISTNLKRRIQALQRQPVDARQANKRREQIDAVRSRFVEAIQRYQKVEQENRKAYKDRLERQFKIVKPNATPDEVRAVVNDDGNSQIFAQAVMGSRYADSQGAYREVQQRHADVQRIERTITELAQLFNDMSIMVEQQGETIMNIEQAAATVEKDTEAGLGYTDKARDSARAARKKRWICFIITLIILIIVGIVVAVVVTNNIRNNNKT